MCCEILPILETKFNLLNRVLRTSLEFGESSNFNCSSIIKNANEINRLVLVHDVTAKSQKGKTDIFRLRAQLAPPPIEFSFAASLTARTSRSLYMLKEALTAIKFFVARSTFCWENQLSAHEILQKFQDRQFLSSGQVCFISGVINLSLPSASLPPQTRVHHTHLPSDDCNV